MNIPQRNELVVCKVTKILDYGVEVTLEEYDNAPGFVPLSQVAARWIKNIRNFVKMGQIRVGKVIYINTEKSQINISFGAVQKGQEEQKLSELRQTKRVQQLLNLVAQETKLSVDEIWDKIANSIMAKYNSVYEGFQDLKRYGKDHIKEIPENLREPLFKIIAKNISISEKDISEHIKLEVRDEKGLDKIKEGFKKMPLEKGLDISVKYIGNGTINIKVIGPDYKPIEKYLTKANEYLTGYFAKLGKIEIIRSEKK